MVAEQHGERRKMRLTTEEADFTKKIVECKTGLANWGFSINVLAFNHLFARKYNLNNTVNYFLACNFLDFHKYFSQFN